MDKNTQISLKKSEELKSRIDDYTQVRKGIENYKVIEERKQHILNVIDGSNEDWEFYKWQLSNRISDLDTLSKILNS